MRRPWMRKLQDSTIAWLPEEARKRAAHNMMRQNRFARRFGLRVINFSLNLLLGSILLSMTAGCVMGLMENGVFTVPDEIKARIPNQDNDSGSQALLDQSPR